MRCRRFAATGRGDAIDLRVAPAAMYCHAFAISERNTCAPVSTHRATAVTLNREMANLGQLEKKPTVSIAALQNQRESDVSQQQSAHFTNF